MNDKSGNSKRIYSIDFLRVIASIFIVLYHYQIFGGYYLDGTINFAGGKFDFSTMVEFFFLSAGFFEVSVRKCRDMKFGTFIASKAIRLIPQVALSVIAYEILALILEKIGYPIAFTISFPGSVITALCLHGIGVFDNPWINGATWFVSVLLLCHIIYYGIVRICKKTKLPCVIPFALMIVLGLALKILKTDLPFLTVYTGRGYSMFFFGCILAYLIGKEGLFAGGKSSTTYDFKLDIVLESVLWPAVIGALIAHLSPAIIPMKGLLLYFIVYPGLFVLFGFGSIRKFFNFRIYGILGNITYDVYVWHGPMILLLAVIMHYFPKIQMSFTPVIWAFLICTFLVGTAAYYLVDKPLNKLIKKE